MHQLSTQRVVLTHGLTTPGVVVHVANVACLVTLFLVKHHDCNEEIGVQQQDDPSVTLRVSVDNSNDAVVCNVHPNVRQPVIQHFPLAEGETLRVASSCRGQFAMYGFFT